MTERRIDTGELPPIVDDATASLAMAQEIRFSPSWDQARANKLSSYLVEQCSDLISLLDEVAATGGQTDIRKGLHVQRVGREYISLWQTTDRGEVRVSFDFKESDGPKVDSVVWREGIHANRLTGFRMARASFVDNKINNIEAEVSIKGAK